MALNLDGTELPNFKGIIATWNGRGQKLVYNYQSFSEKLPK